MPTSCVWSVKSTVVKGEEFLLSRTGWGERKSVSMNNECSRLPTQTSFCNMNWPLTERRRISTSKSLGFAKGWNKLNAQKSRGRRMARKFWCLCSYTWIVCAGSITEAALQSWGNNSLLVKACFQRCTSGERIFFFKHEVLFNVTLQSQNVVHPSVRFAAKFSGDIVVAWPLQKFSFLSKFSGKLMSRDLQTISSSLINLMEK